MAKVAGDGVALLYACIIMLTLAWVFAMLRLGVRKWKNNFGLDDWLMFVGLALYSVTVGLVIRCCFYGAGQKSKNLEPYDMMMGTKLFFVAQFFYCACSVPIKTSICVTMLRICDSRRRFVWTIWGIIGTTITTAIIFIIAVANICHPIERLWGETTRGTCNTNLNSSIGFFFSAVSIITDWTLAILPAVLLWKIQMKQRVKLPVICMLSLGVFASCATVIRLGYLTRYNDPAEFVYSTGAIGLWSIMEEGIGIVAGSMPALRPLLNLPIFGRSTYGSAGASNQGSSHMNPSHFSNKRKKSQRDDLEMDTFHGNMTTKVSHGRQEKQSLDDSDSQKFILKSTQVVMTTERV